MSQTRRELLMQGLLSAGGIGLRALATGLPATFLGRMERSADAAPPPADSEAQFLILSTSSAGDPLNANTPGTYEHAAIQHSAEPRMEKTALRLGVHPVTAAAPWASLPQPVLDRTVFFHHSTRTQSHPHHPQVLELHGASTESAPALYSQHLAPRLGTAQSEPLLVGACERVTAAGRGLPRLPCRELRAALTSGPVPLAGLGPLRDRSLDELYRRLRSTGTKAQRDYVDRHARSREATTALGDRLLADLGTLASDSAADQVVAAAVLVRLHVAPVVVIGIPFGGDNHFDYEFATESAQTVTGVAHLAALLQKLREYGLHDHTSVALLNVFGRTLHRHGRVGRDHWAGHSTGVLIGKPFAGGVIGGLQPGDGDFVATAICARTGTPAHRGTADAVPAAETLAALGKTLGRGLGLPHAVLEQAIPSGRIVGAALA